jgi:hypothetical protein
MSNGDIRFFLQATDLNGAVTSLEFRSTTLPLFMDYLENFLLAVGFHPATIADFLNEPSVQQGEDHGAG